MIKIYKRYKTCNILLVIIFTFLMISGCGNLKSNSSESKGILTSDSNSAGKSWTIFLYLCGTDLESENGAASANLSELMKISNNKNVKFIIETGGTSTWKNDFISSDKIQRYILEDNNLKLVDEEKLSSMGDAKTLGEFLKWGTKNYPADKYMTILWNHGGGSISGVEFDELYNNDSLSLKELAEGLSMANTQFEVIGFDACLMATLENASAIAPYGKYMVASEEYEPGGGWNYQKWGQYLSENPECNGSQLGKEICDSYLEKCAVTDDNSMATLSVVDLSKINNLKVSFDNMAKEMTGLTQDINQFKAFSRAAVKAENYGGNTNNEGYTNMVDLGDLALNTENVLDKTSAALLSSLKEAVIYKVNGESRKKSKGISVFYPLSASNDEYNKYSEVAISENYLVFLETISSNWKAPDWVEEKKPENAVSSNKYNINGKTYISDDGYYTLEIKDGLDAVQSVKFSLYYMDYDYKQYMFLGLDNDMDGDYETGKFYDNFRGVWPSINGYYCEPNLIEEGENYNLYSIPILLNGEEMNLRAAYVFDDDDNGHYEIYGAWKGIDNTSGMSAKDIIKIKNGDKITFIFDSYNMDSDKNSTYKTDSFIVNGPLVMKETDLFDGDYMYRYEITDVFGNVTYSEPVIMECKNGDINLYETE